MDDLFSFGKSSGGNTNSSPSFFINPSIFFQKNGFYPLLPLPKNFWDGSFEKSYLAFPPANSEVIFIPTVDPITSEYGRNYMLTRFTIEFFKFVNSKFFPFGFSKPGEKFGYASHVYRIFYGLPPLSILFIQQVDDDIRQTLSYYLDAPFNLALLEASLPNKKTFVEKISKIEYTRKGQKAVITLAEAESFIRNVEGKIDAHLLKFFTDANLTELQKNVIEKPNESSYYTVDADIILESEAIAILDKIGPLYFAKTGKKFNVNSGTRDAYRQAAAMWVKYPKDKTFSEYPNRKLINEILDAIKKAGGKSNNEIIQAMTAVIQNQIDRKEYISKHLIAGCIDIATQADIPTGVAALSASEQRIMIEIAVKVTGGTAIKENNPPHIHIQFK